MKIALIGGAGLIGHNIALRMKDHEVLVVDSLSVNNKFTVTNPAYHAMIDERLALLRHADIPLMTIDARDYHQLSNMLGHFKPDTIVHLAAVAHIDRANKDPFNTFDHNLRTLENALDVAVAVGASHFVFFSSSTAYGDFQKATVDETEACRPRGIYGSLKFAGELITRAYGDVSGLPWTIVRPCALYGPRCVSGRVTQKFIENARAGKPLHIDGDGQGRHDFTFIEDLINGVERILTTEAAKGEVFNITGGNARSIKELADIVTARYPVEVTYGEPDPEKPSRGTMSNEKARRLLGYQPRHTLEVGMSHYMDWYEIGSKLSVAPIVGRGPVKITS